MRAVVVYESMYGNTRQLAEAIGAGLGACLQAEVCSAAAAGPERLAGADLLVVGGPTHAWGMSRPSTRAAAAEQAAGKGLSLDGSATGRGVREWLAGPLGTSQLAAAFDTRLDAPAAVTGRASRAIGRALQRRGLSLIGKPRSFRVSKANRLCPGELDRARDWGRQLATDLLDRPVSHDVAGWQG